MLHLILKSYTDEGFGRNVYQKCFSLSIYTVYIFSSFDETVTDADSSGSLFCAFFYLFLCRKSCMLHLHLVLGRIRLKLLNIKSIVSFGYMYALLDLRSITDEDASRNV